MDWFGNYARVIFTLYGDRVKSWLTLNEPLIMCDVAYSTEYLAPEMVDHDALFICVKNVIMAHARAYRIYEEEFKAKYNGESNLIIIYLQLNVDNWVFNNTNLL